MQRWTQCAFNEEPDFVRGPPRVVLNKIYFTIINTNNRLGKCFYKKMRSHGRLINFGKKAKINPQSRTFSRQKQKSI